MRQDTHNIKATRRKTITSLCPHRKLEDKLAPRE